MKTFYNVHPLILQWFGVLIGARLLNLTISDEDDGSWGLVCVSSGPKYEEVQGEGRLQLRHFYFLFYESAAEMKSEEVNENKMMVTGGPFPSSSASSALTQ